MKYEYVLDSESYYQLNTIKIKEKELKNIAKKLFFNPNNEY